MNRAFQRHDVALEKLRGGHDDDRAKNAKSKDANKDANKDAKVAAQPLLKQADELLKGIRKAAVQAIHESCGAKHDDDDDDSDKDKDQDKDQDKDGKHHAAAVNITLTGTPAEMARQADTAMDIVMDALRAKLAALPTATTKPTSARTPKPTKAPHAGESHRSGR